LRTSDCLPHQALPGLADWALEASPAELQALQALLPRIEAAAPLGPVGRSLLRPTQLQVLEALLVTNLEPSPGSSQALATTRRSLSLGASSHARASLLRLLRDVTGHHAMPSAAQPSHELEYETEVLAALRPLRNSDDL